METSVSVAERITAEVQKLHRYFDQIARCQVVIAAPHKHHRHGPRYSIHVELSVPQGPLVIQHEPAGSDADEDIYVAIRETFDAARRRIEDHARRLRGDVKSHHDPLLQEPPAV